MTTKSRRTEADEDSYSDDKSFIRNSKMEFGDETRGKVNTRVTSGRGDSEEELTNDRSIYVSTETNIKEAQPKASSSIERAAVIEKY
jgi:hypothetical protein